MCVRNLTLSNRCLTNQGRDQQNVLHLKSWHTSFPFFIIENDDRITLSALPDAGFNHKTLSFFSMFLMFLDFLHFSIFLIFFFFLLLFLFFFSSSFSPFAFFFFLFSFLLFFFLFSFFFSLFSFLFLFSLFFSFLFSLFSFLSFSFSFSFSFLLSISSHVSRTSWGWCALWTHKYEARVSPTVRCLLGATA